MNHFAAHPLEWLSASPALLSKNVAAYQWALGVPQLLGGADTDVSLSFDRFASWTVLFLALYVVFAVLLKIVPGTRLQRGKLPAIAASRCIGIVHCCIVVPLSILALHRQNPDWTKLEYLGLNTPLEQRVIELSVAYFTADFVHFILFEPDLLMFFHHVFSILMMSSAGLSGRGATCAMAALTQGEITNPFQSAWTIARTAKWTGVLNWLSPLFTLVFVLVRVPIVPIWTLAFINRNLLYGPNSTALPGWIVYSWSGMSVLMALGGWVWSYALIKGLRKFYKAKKTQQGAAKKTQ